MLTHAALVETPVRRWLVAQTTVGPDVATVRSVIEAIEEVARTGQTLAGAKRQIAMAEAERDEASMLYLRAQANLQAAIKDARAAAGEPGGL